jgi:alanyl-tRNA synthetase
VGKDTYHHTFFEMLGNWSFADYFKAEAIEWAWQLLTEVWGINPDNLYATVFAGDEKDKSDPDRQAAKLWPKVTSLPAERVLFCGRKDNFWEMGETGPCGPCSEIHIDLGPEHCDMKNVSGHKCQVNGDCARFIELWNLVFIQFNQLPDGKLVPLSANYVDTGAGLERIVAVMQGKKSNYDTDLFMPVIEAVSDMTGHKYTSQLDNVTDNAFRVISDHIRSLVFAITDGAIPSNEGRGYVIRRLLRRACRFGRELGMHEPFMYKLVPVVTDFMSDAFGEIKERADYVETVIESEEASFGRTLDRGIEIFNSAAKRAQKNKQQTINGQDAFQLYDTYGFPLDLTELMARERNLKVDTAGFAELMEQQRQRARAAQRTASVMAVSAETELPATEDLHKYHMEQCKGKLVGFIKGEAFEDKGKIETGSEAGLVLDKTCFYAESGGQVGDCGIIESEIGQFIVEDTIKLADCVVHQGRIAEGMFNVGDRVKAAVSKDRDSIRKNHTATHLLQWALQQVVGKTVAQQGSLVGPDYLRFDFTCPKALTAGQIKEVTMPRTDAEKLGAMALFGEKYGEDVRVVAIGAEDETQISQAFSREFCGGTHVDRTGSIGGFKIIRQESISAGVRRIMAMTGTGLNKYLTERSDIVDELTGLLKAPAEELIERVANLIKENKRLAKELKSASKGSGSDTIAEAKKLLAGCEKIDGTAVIAARISQTSAEQARTAIDTLKKKAKSVVVVLAFAEDDKVTLLAGVTDDLIARGVKAGEIIKEIAPIVEGGGGGRPQMAHAGGKNPGKIDECLIKAKKLIKEKLTNS